MTVHTVLDDISENKELFNRGYTTIIIGTEVVDYNTMCVDIPPFPEYNSGNNIAIGGEGCVFSADKLDNGNRYIYGVIESHYATSDWQFVLSNYKEWLLKKGKDFSYIFVLLGDELVHHEINGSNLV